MNINIIKGFRVKKIVLDATIAQLKDTPCFKSDLKQQVIQSKTRTCKNHAKTNIASIKFEKVRIQKLR